MKFLGEICHNRPNDFLGANVYKTLKSYWQSFLTILQWINTTSVIFKRDILSPFLTLAILHLVLPNDLIV